ncbi:binding-protein-dependent transport systems inner membrane component [Beutenbergia cavernae DSM 12333]|uniref:Binding-protein-dependent transport systems inner membrane component n=1 Tax=Beutenbergia cavernae (strain ATCC BAA-8 / DSM 12333 / CCUG 43141 / JCM 11478 / NBRC 16432 / NCIMB 13614 / HKI 0122) TaxID=471853 RepID=C5C3J3_BEUC1|nr:ABC transporter permease [Beutenbergia cavernae]ACQ81902.1 binding-protein-dependent transport systems inner membrane component [Beutenbergia cavernae DSM 12333]
MTDLATAVGSAAPTLDDGTGPPRAPRSRGAWTRMRRRPTFWGATAVLGVLTLIALVPGPFAGLFGNGDPRVCDISRRAGLPEPGHPFGFDVQGCDLYAGVIHGARSSLVVGVVATLLAVTIAVALGSTAGLAGRAVDTVVVRLTDIFLGFPFLLGAVIVLNSMPSRGPLTVAVVLAVFGWPTLARLMRSSVRSVRSAEYVEAARAYGDRGFHLFRRHILPNAISPVVVLASNSMGAVIVAEAALTFLGVGLRAPSISWGLQLNAGQNQFTSHPHLLLFPSLFLVVTVLCFIVLGDVLRDALDPKVDARA